MTGGDKYYNKKTKTMNTKKEYGTIADNTKENMRGIHPHIEKLFNNNQPTKFRVLDLIKQRQTMSHLDYPITQD